VVLGLPVLVPFGLWQVVGRCVAAGGLEMAGTLVVMASGIVVTDDGLLIGGRGLHHCRGHRAHCTAMCGHFPPWHGLGRGCTPGMIGAADAVLFFKDSW
jgi:hypothetical protein